MVIMTGHSYLFRLLILLGWVMNENVQIYFSGNTTEIPVDRTIYKEFKLSEVN